MPEVSSMNCPKCEEGELVKIKFVKTKINGYECDKCSQVWFENELIRFDTGHVLPSISEEMGEVQELNRLDQDHRNIKYTYEKNF